MKLMQRLVLASIVLSVGGLSACSSNPGCCIDASRGDFDYIYPYDFAYSPPDFGYPGVDLAFPQPDFGQGDFGHHHHHDFGIEDLALPGVDLSQQHVDFAQSGVDLSQPPVQDLATRPDLGGTIVACESCLQASCSGDVSACEGDPNCVTTLSCVVADGCFTFAGGSSSFGSCVDSCVLSQSLTVPQTVAVLGEISALASCAGSCVDTCGGN